jgi:hypothetical protein
MPITKTAATETKSEKCQHVATIDIGGKGSCGHSLDVAIFPSSSNNLLFMSHLPHHLDEPECLISIGSRLASRLHNTLPPSTFT